MFIDGSFISIAVTIFAVVAPTTGMVYKSSYHDFYGRCITLRPLKNGQTIQIVWKELQLINSIFPSFDRAFRALGFDKVDWWHLLRRVAFGGEVELKGPRYINYPSYNEATIKDVFMLPERALAKALLNCVFNKKANIAYLREPITIEETGSGYKFDTSIKFRKIVIMFHASGAPEREAYRIVIEGSGENLNTHLFQFQPSNDWLCSRFPENCR